MKRTFLVFEMSRSYQEAMQRGQDANLSPTIPVLLGLALNYSVFYYEILNNPDKVLFCPFC